MKLLYIALVVIASAAVAAWITGESYEWGWMSDLAPNVLTEAVAILVTVAVVQRLIDRRRTTDEGVRVKQALTRVSGDLHVMADFLLWDYMDMHANEPTYVRPPPGLRDLLAHFRDGLPRRVGPWPDDPYFLAATKSLAGRLDEQLQRHERVLDHAFIAAAYQYIRTERMTRNMYNRPEGGGDARRIDTWRVTALRSSIGAVVTFLDAFDPYARRYLDEDRWQVALDDDAIDSAKSLRTYSEDDPA